MGAPALLAFLDGALVLAGILLATGLGLTLWFSKEEDMTKGSKAWKTVCALAQRLGYEVLPYSGLVSGNINAVEYRIQGLEASVRELANEKASVQRQFCLAQARNEQLSAQLLALCAYLGVEIRWFDGETTPAHYRVVKKAATKKRTR